VNPKLAKINSCPTAKPDENKMEIDQGALVKESAQTENGEGFELQRTIGPLSHRERAEKIYKFLVKKKQKHNSKKYTYKCRQDVAEKRLRIKGRFVTRE
jgi:hypothetical protein